MDQDLYANIFVNEFCNRLEKTRKALRDMHSFYLWDDKRPGSVIERFETDASEWGEYQKMFKV
jgi:hypothetical protein